MSKNLRVEIIDNLAIITLDPPEARVNILSRQVLTELRDHLTALAANRELSGLIITSGKDHNFCAGADLAVIEGIRTAAEARALSRQGQELCNQLAALPFPSVAAIHGSCLGGGTELALACTYRLLSDDPQTFLALPETQLGLIPAFGGTQRLPRLVGISEALRLITTGSRVSPEQSRRTGLADGIVAKEHLAAAARRLIHAHPASGPRNRAHRFEQLPPWRKLLFLRALRAARRTQSDHYPAIPAAISSIVASFNMGPDAALDNEARLAGEMAITDTARHLQQVFRLRQRFSKTGRDGQQHCHRVGVVGAGMMGGHLITLLAQSGVQGRLLNRTLPGLKKALGEMSATLATAGYSATETARIAARITYDTGLRGLRGQEVVIEAVTENLGVKKSVLNDIAREVPVETLIVSSTSALSISEMARDVVHPGRVAGMHFCNPTGNGQLVEVIAGEQTSATTSQAVMNLAHQLGRIPIAVRDRPGFLLNRLLYPYLNEALLLLENGGRIDAIDQVMRNFGMALGPFALLDQLGWDIVAQVAETLTRGFGQRMQPSPLLARMLESGRLGEKNGKGFYRSGRGGHRRVDGEIYPTIKLSPPPRAGLPPAEICDRLLLMMLNEAARCLAEEVVADAATVDAALLFGVGFPTYTGGLLRYDDDRSAANVVKKLRELEISGGERYAPAELLQTLAESGRKFY